MGQIHGGGWGRLSPSLQSHQDVERSPGLAPRSSHRAVFPGPITALHSGADSPCQRRVSKRLGCREASTPLLGSTTPAAGYQSWPARALSDPLRAIQVLGGKTLSGDCGQEG